MVALCKNIWREFVVYTVLQILPPVQRMQNYISIIIHIYILFCRQGHIEVRIFLYEDYDNV
jgi:hypothetical protein